MSALSVKALQKRGLDVPGALATLLCWPQQGLPAVLPLLASCGAHAVATQREKQRLCQPGDVARAPGGVQTPFLQRSHTHGPDPRFSIAGFSEAQTRPMFTFVLSAGALFERPRYNMRRAGRATTSVSEGMQLHDCARPAVITLVDLVSVAPLVLGPPGQTSGGS